MTGSTKLTWLQTSSAALFTHRNKRPNAETITRSFSTDAEYDGVEFVYQDPDTEQSETIMLPLDGSAIKYKRFEIPGIRNFTQAWYRANREYRKLLGQRLAIEMQMRAPVTGVSLPTGGQGPQLQVQGLGTLKLSDVKEVG